MGIVLVGTEDTNNPLATQNEGCYQNVSILSDIRKPSLSLLESIAIIESNDVEADGKCIYDDLSTHVNIQRKNLKYAQSPVQYFHLWL